MFNIISDEAVMVMSAIKANNGDIRFVGGCIRDFLLERNINDVDLATTLLPNDVFSTFKGVKAVKVIPTGVAHGTVTVMVGKKSFEITTLRRDVKCDGRHARVEFTSDWYFDASRRDFTFNAIYMDLSGKIYDYFDGQRHLKNGEIYFIGNPEERVCEDYLRIIRAFRFHADVCNVPLDSTLVDACRKYASCIDYLSGERIKGEFFKILSLKKAHVAFENMDLCKVLKVVIPFKVSYSFLENLFCEKLDPFLKIVFMCIQSGNDISSIFAYIKERFVFSRKEVLRFMAISQVDIKKLSTYFASEMGRRGLLAKLGSDLYHDVVLISILNGLLPENELAEYMGVKDKYKDVFPVSGHDMQLLGYFGQDLGMELKLLRKKWEDSGCELSKEDLLKFVSHKEKP